MTPQEFFAYSTPDKEHPGMSRRDFVRYLVAAATLDFLGFGGISSDSPHIPTPGVHQERNPTFSPVTVDLGVVAVTADGMRHYDGDEKIRKDIIEQTERITHTTSGAYIFNTEFYNHEANPDSSRQTDKGTREKYYSDKQLKGIADKYRRELSRQSIIMTVVNSAGIERFDVGGLAVSYGTKDCSPWIIISTGRKKPGGGTYGHELGHVLSPKGLGYGLGHERVMNCQLEDTNGNPTQLYAIDTIQNLINSGCGLVKKNDAVNVYASPRSVMGNSGVYREGIPEGRPIYSPPNIAFLDPRRQVIRIEPESGTYPLSYDFSKLFGVELPLPRDHALKKILPDADTLFFGPIVQSVKDENTPFESADAQKTIGVFATWNDSRETALLDISLFRDIIPGDNTENVIYADEQLNIVVVSGYGDEGEYMRTIGLDTPEGRAVLEEAKQRTSERNQLLLDARKTDKKKPH